MAGPAATCRGRSARRTRLRRVQPSGPGTPLFVRDRDGTAIRRAGLVYGAAFITAADVALPVRLRRVSGHVASAPRVRDLARLPYDPCLRQFLARREQVDLLAVERLPLQQRLGDPLQQRAVLFERAHGRVVRLVEQALHLCIDALGYTLRDGPALADL